MVSRRNKTAFWGVLAFALATTLVVSALAMAHGAHRNPYREVPTSAQSGLRPTSHEPKPSAAIGVVGPATKTVTTSKRARRTPKKESDR